jgi:hypothetical protein|tara:strand:- start:76 stop:201 length:126 start_codon:yes stop_codon:yes gene_type:complete
MIALGFLNDLHVVAKKSKAGCGVGYDPIRDAGSQVTSNNAR